jgi:hypothetical protein
MAKAVASTRNPGIVGGQVKVDVFVVLDNGQSYLEPVVVNFSRSLSQLTQDIKAAVVTSAAIPGRAVTITENDVVLFGGPA